MSKYLTVNIDLQDRLVNGQLGTVIHIARNSQDIPKKCLRFGDTRAEIKTVNADIFGKLDSWLSIEKIKADIKIKLSKNSSTVIKRTQHPLMFA